MNDKTPEIGDTVKIPSNSPEHSIGVIEKMDSTSFVSVRMKSGLLIDVHKDDLTNPYSDLKGSHERIQALETMLGKLLRTEPDRHKESMSYFPPHSDGSCIWCEAKALLNQK